MKSWSVFVSWLIVVRSDSQSHAGLVRAHGQWGKAGFVIDAAGNALPLPLQGLDETGKEAHAATYAWRAFASALERTSSPKDEKRSVTPRARPDQCKSWECTCAGFIKLFAVQPRVTFGLAPQSAQLWYAQNMCDLKEPAVSMMNGGAAPAVTPAPAAVAEAATTVRQVSSTVSAQQGQERSESSKAVDVAKAAEAVASPIHARPLKDYTGMPKLFVPSTPPMYPPSETADANNDRAFIDGWFLMGPIALAFLFVCVLFYMDFDLTCKDSGTYCALDAGENAIQYLLGDKATGEASLRPRETAIVD